MRVFQGWEKNCCFQNPGESQNPWNLFVANRKGRKNGSVATKSQQKKESDFHEGVFLPCSNQDKKVPWILTPEVHIKLVSLNKKNHLNNYSKLLDVLQKVFEIFYEFFMDMMNFVS